MISVKVTVAVVVVTVDANIDAVFAAVAGHDVTAGRPLSAVTLTTTASKAPVERKLLTNSNISTTVTTAATKSVTTATTTRAQKN